MGAVIGGGGDRGWLPAGRGDRVDLVEEGDRADRLAAVAQRCGDDVDGDDAAVAAAAAGEGARLYAGHPRSPGRVNRILVAVREFYRFGAAERALAPDVLNYLYELGHEPEFRSRGGPRARHRRRELRRAESPDQATAEEVCGLLGEASSARDQFLILLLALTGLRVGQALGLRRQDLHLVSDAGRHGLPVPGGGAQASRSQSGGRELRCPRSATSARTLRLARRSVKQLLPRSRPGRHSAR